MTHAGSSGAFSGSTGLVCHHCGSIDRAYADRRGVRILTGVKSALSAIEPLPMIGAVVPDDRRH
jgi:hypothetical protein